MSSYSDFLCNVKITNNELFATAVNHLNKEIVRSGGTSFTLYVLALDGELACTTTTLHERAGVAKQNVTLVEKDANVAAQLRRILPQSTIIHSTMQRFVQGSQFRPGGYNTVYFDWMCTPPGNNVEKCPQAALSDMLRRCDHPYVVFAQTFSMRQKHKGPGGSINQEYAWLRGADTIYEDEKGFVCSNLAERALR